MALAAVYAGGAPIDGSPGSDGVAATDRAAELPPGSVGPPPAGPAFQIAAVIDSGQAEADFPRHRRRTRRARHRRPPTRPARTYDHGAELAGHADPDRKPVAIADLHPDPDPDPDPDAVVLGNAHAERDASVADAPTSSAGADATGTASADATGTPTPTPSPTLPPCPS
jgi:hypothetical protein